MPKFICETAIANNKQVSSDVFCLSFMAPEIAAVAKPGMFINLDLKVKDAYLRRPFGIAGVDNASSLVTIYYRVIGKGTKALSKRGAGHELSVLGPLGNGFPVDCKAPLLVGGGMGLAPLLFVQQYYGQKADVLIGGRNAAEIFWQDLFKPYTNNIFITTDDGSLGVKGFTTTLLPELLTKKQYDAVLVCGPEIMMKGIAKLSAEKNVPCYVSLEKRMACGLGACLSCSCDKTDGARAKICKDGPVFLAQEVFK